MGAYAKVYHRQLVDFDSLREAGYEVTDLSDEGLYGLLYSGLVATADKPDVAIYQIVETMQHGKEKIVFDIETGKVADISIEEMSERLEKGELVLMPGCVEYTPTGAIIAELSVHHRGHHIFLAYGEYKLTVIVYGERELDFEAAITEMISSTMVIKPIKASVIMGAIDTVLDVLNSGSGEE